MLMAIGRLALPSSAKSPSARESPPSASLTTMVLYTCRDPRSVCEGLQGRDDAVQKPGRMEADKMLDMSGRLALLSSESSLSKRKGPIQSHSAWPSWDMRWAGMQQHVQWVQHWWAWDPRSQTGLRVSNPFDYLQHSRKRSSSA